MLGWPEWVAILSLGVFGGMRLAGSKGNAYKAMAHVAVGLAFGWGYGAPSEVVAVCAWALTGVEVVMFLITRAIPRLLADGVVEGS